jgi:hypothetical protein
MSARPVAAQLTPAVCTSAPALCTCAAPAGCTCAWVRRASASHCVPEARTGPAAARRTSLCSEEPAFRPHGPAQPQTKGRPQRSRIRPVTSSYQRQGRSGRNGRSARRRAAGRRIAELVVERAASAVASGGSPELAQVRARWSTFPKGRGRVAAATISLAEEPHRPLLPVVIATGLEATPLTPEFQRLFLRHGQRTDSRLSRACAARAPAAPPSR